MKNIPVFSVALTLLLFIAACGSLERDIDIQLPEPERILTVECYLEAGQPYRLLLTETKGFFEDLDACPLIKGATVIIKHNGVSDTLIEAPYFSTTCPADSLFGVIPFFNADYTRFYNYGSASLCPEDYVNDFELEVFDHEGDRYATAVTRFLPVVNIDSITDQWVEGRRKASVFVWAKDEAASVDYYRIMLHDSSLTIGAPPFNIANNPDFDVTIDDARFFNGETITFGTGFDYKENDTVIATFYHIEPKYHDFLETLADAEAANFSPFAQPAQIVTNITGGQGIFTTLSYDRDTLVVEK